MSRMDGGEKREKKKGGDEVESILKKKDKNLQICRCLGLSTEMIERLDIKMRRSKVKLVDKVQSSTPEMQKGHND